jgi:hypothetical protein
MGSQGVLGLTLAVVALVASACSSGDDGSATIDTVAPSTSGTEPHPTTPAPCRDNRHLAVFDINGTLTSDEQGTIDWLNNPAAEPSPRAGATELVSAYADHGYEIMYVTSLPATTRLAGQPAADALKGWLERHQFPVQPNSVNTAATAKPTELSGELVGLAGQGVHMDVGYTNNRDDVVAFQTAGVSKIFGLGDAAKVAGATRVANDDLVGLVDGIEAQRRVCS